MKRETSIKFENQSGFASIANDLYVQGYSIQTAGLPLNLCEALFTQVQAMQVEKFEPAGIGRQLDYTHNEQVRSDEICWINGSSPAGEDWLVWTGQLQQYLNRQLFLGLFSFESHFAHYSPGAFYSKHLDAFKGESNRVLSLVLYLNKQWMAEDGGELLLHTSDKDVIRIVPEFGTLVTFLSEDFLHEVLQTRRDRYSIAGWYRMNSTTAQRVDPAE
jgi:SM-20-related protein